VFVERLWRSVKYEEVYLRAHESVSEARTSIGPTWTFIMAGVRTRALKRKICSDNRDHLYQFKILAPLRVTMPTTCYYSANISGYLPRVAFFLKNSGSRNALAGFMRPQSPLLLCSAWSEPKIKLSHQLFSMLFARAAELPIITLFSFGLSNAPVFEHALLTQLALVASWVSARDVAGLRKFIAYRAARPIHWIMTHLLLGRIRKSRTPYHVAQEKRFRGVPTATLSFAFHLIVRPAYGSPLPPRAWLLQTLSTAFSWTNPISP
jgi:hypothetical protein